MILPQIHLRLYLCLFVVCLVVFTAGEVDPNRGQVHHTSPSPCCFPYKFQAVVTQLTTFSVQNQVVTRLYRDWDQKIQVHEQSTFTVDTIQSTGLKTILDYTNMKEYTIIAGACSEATLNSGMLEPCMPDNAVYLGKSYLGQGVNTAHFDTWYFQRTDLNRNLDMTVSVTSDRCVPVMEHIAGTNGGDPCFLDMPLHFSLRCTVREALGSPVRKNSEAQAGTAEIDNLYARDGANVPVNNLVLFTNVTDVSDETVFRIPVACFGNSNNFM